MRRVGSFEVAQWYIEKMPREVAEVFASLRVLVVRAEALFHVNAISYTAISPSFEIVNEGEVTPVYDLEITKNADGSLHGKFTRVV